MSELDDVGRSLIPQDIKIVEAVRFDVRRGDRAWELLCEILATLDHRTNRALFEKKIPEFLEIVDDWVKRARAK